MSMALKKIGGTMGDIRSYSQMKGVLGADEMNKINTGMRKRMSPEDKTSLGIATETERLAWIKQYLLDPQTSLNKGFNKVVVEAIQSETHTAEWFHAEELADQLKIK